MEALNKTYLHYLSHEVFPKSAVSTEDFAMFLKPVVCTDKKYTALTHISSPCYDNIQLQSACGSLKAD